MTIAARHQACRYTSTARSATEHGFRVTLLLSHQFRAGFWAVWLWLTPLCGGVLSMLRGGP